MSLPLAWQSLAGVALGGALGSTSRYVLTTWIMRAADSSFPFGTLAVNLLGSLAAGWLLAWMELHTVSPGWRAFLLAGVLGGFTTWSAMMLDVLVLHRAGLPSWAWLYVAISLSGGVVLVWLGWRAGTFFSG